MKLKSYKLLFYFFSFLADKTDGKPFFVRYKLLLGTLILTLIGTTAKASGKVSTNDTIRAKQQTQHVKCYEVTVIEDNKDDKILLNSIVREVKGVIVDEYDEPIIGGTVKIKDSSNSTFSDIDGNFSIKANAGDTLVFSYIGLKTRQLLVSELKNEQSITMYDEFEPVIVIKPKLMCYVGYITSIFDVAKGIVRDQSGQAIVGAQVQVKNRAEVTTSDLNGRFSLNVLPNDILVVSYLSMNTEEIPVHKIKNDSIVVLKENDYILCYEVAVVPFKEIKKADKYGCDQLDTQPVSPEGDLDGFQKWLENEIRYNEKMKNDITEEILIGFVIDKNGKLTDKKIFTNVSKETKKEILRVLSSSGRWQPGECNGGIVKSVVSLSINLLLPD